MTCDDRSFSIHSVMVMDLTVSVIYFYPRLVALHNINPDCYEPPAPIRCTYEKLQDDGVYLLGKAFSAPFLSLFFNTFLI